MNIFKRIPKAKIVVVVISFFTYNPLMAQSDDSIKDLAIVWRNASFEGAKENIDLELVIKNPTNSNIKIKNWELWFNSMYPVFEKSSDKYTIHNKTGNLFSIEFKSYDIKSKDSIVVNYQSEFAISNISTTPNGFYFQQKEDIHTYYAINNVKYEVSPRSAQKQNEILAALYIKNEKLNKHSAIPLVFPTPFKIEENRKKNYNFSTINYYCDAEFINCDIYLKQLSGKKTIESHSNVNKSTNFVVKYNPKLNNEAYNLTINQHGIRIEASSNQGVFYAIQSLRSMLYSEDIAAGVLRFNYVDISDVPRYGYRGFMLDIARNFKNKEVIKKYIDLMASYKLNVLHLHCIDDEAWRLEIPSIPELIEVGSHRSPSFEDGKSLMPAYGSGAVTTDRQYLSKHDFVEILKYASERFITVIPEIETPGHARAAIKSMAYRYNKYQKLGNSAEAEKYLLHDFEDKSSYSSPQNFRDNVLNPALPSVYTFLNQVLEDIAVMYKKAGVKFEKISLGGDEVPPGVWEKSPKIATLMNEVGMKSVHDVWPYYISKINDLCISKGLSLAGWEEIGMSNDGNGMKQNPNLNNKDNLTLDVWNNVIGGGQEDLAYRLANTGYKTVLLSASNMYFDMMWNTGFDEPGLKWATYADLYHSYSLFPEDYFANIHTYYSGEKIGKKGFADRVRLNEKGRSNFVGVKGGLFAETIHVESQLDYLAFPRFFALVERAWSPKKSYESESTFDENKLQIDYANFINKIGYGELRKLENVKYRLPGIGAKSENSKLYLNTEYPGFDIYYSTTDDTISVNSLKYNGKPIDISSVSKVSFAIINNDGRVGPTYVFKK